MKTISLEYAQTLSGDPEAIKRKFVTAESLADAQELAAEAVSMPTFGKLGYLSLIGQPHQWWVKNSKVYARLEQGPTYDHCKRFAVMLELADHICFEEKTKIVTSRLDALKLTNQTKTEEYKYLKGWLNQNNYNL